MSLADVERVTFAVGLLEVAWGSIANHLTVDHDRDVVAKLLSFIHAVS